MSLLCVSKITFRIEPSIITVLRIEPSIITVSGKFFLVPVAMGLQDNILISCYNTTEEDLPLKEQSTLGPA